MSDRGFGRRIPVHRRIRNLSPSLSPSPSPSPSPLRRRRRTPVPRRSSKSARPVKSLVLRRCNSEPALWIGGVTGDDHRNMTAVAEATEEEEVLFRPLTCTDLFLSPDYSIPRSPQKCSEGLNKDAKVVVNVTVEGSPGPIRTMVRLGCSVEETIRLVVRKYREEGRTPNLDKDAASIFELHHSYFSLESLNKSDMIGTIGTRNFYLRKKRSKGEVESLNENSDAVVSVIANTSLPISPPLMFLPAFIINKLKRRTRKLWKILGCLQCSG